LDAVRSLGPDDELLNLRLGDLRLPRLDIITVRGDRTRAHFAVAAIMEGTP
jgi:hypothetical protein